MKNLSTSFYTFLLVLTTLISINAQGWEKSFIHAVGLGKGFDVVEANDGGYVMCGDIDLPTGAIRHYTWLVKTDTAGNELWSHIYNYGAIAMEEGRALVETADGGFMIAGANLAGNVQVLRTDANGDSLWTKTYVEEGQQTAQTLIPNSTNDGYLLVGSLVTEPDIWEQTIWVLGVDSEGDSLWSQSYPSVTGLGTMGMDIMPAANDHFLIAGTSNAQIALLKIDATGNELWFTIEQASVGDVGLAVHEMVNGDILVGGYLTGFAGHSPLLLRFNSDGELIDDAINTETVSFGAVSDIQATIDGGFILTGSGFDFWSSLSDKGYLLKLNGNLEKGWDIILDSNIQGTAVRQTSDGSIVMSGNSDSGMFLKKLGSVISTGTSALLSVQFKAKITPNPATEKLSISVLEEALNHSLTFQLFDVTGRLVQSIRIDEGIKTVDISKLKAGAYSYLISDQGKCIEKWRFIG